MKGQIRRWQVVPLLLASAALGFAQTNAQTSGAMRPGAGQVGPGTINYVEGSVMVNGHPLTSQSVGNSALQPGDTVATAQGYAEVLMTPGAFLRVGPNSQVRLISAGLADTRAEVVNGSAILEADQLIKGTNLSVLVSGATAHIDKTGLYLYDAGQHAVLVLDGKATIQETNGSRTLDKHDEVLLASDRPLKKRSFDESQIKAEPLYVWSMARSEAESQVSTAAARNPSVYYAAGPGWFWDPYWNFYGFWPADAALFSPFGWGFYSPLYFGYGFYGGGFYGGRYVAAHYYLAHSGQYAIANRRVAAGAGMRTTGLARSTMSGFHAGGFGGGFHGGGGRR
jgi:hypothetical protein